MEQSLVIEMIQNMFIQILVLSAPVMVVSMVVGLIISIFQTITQIQESTLTFVPKIIACVFALVILLPWMMNYFIGEVKALFDKIPGLL